MVFKYAFVGTTYVIWWDPEKHKEVHYDYDQWSLPVEVKQFIASFDSKEKVEPITFTIPDDVLPSYLR